MSGSGDSCPADEHLGENLAALVDGELCHESRDRVLAHLATCPSCKAEADAQRQVKSVFAESPLPGPSATLLARLQGLPAAGAADPEGPTAGSGEAPGASGPSGRPSAGFGLDLLPGGSGRGSLLSGADLRPAEGFRIHESGAARVPRGHRIAFAAAGAVSLAAFAIGGAVSTASTSTAPAASASSSSSAVAAGSASTAVGSGRAVTRGPAEAPAALPGTLGAAGPHAPLGRLAEMAPLEIPMAQLGQLPLLGSLLAPAPALEPFNPTAPPPPTGLASPTAPGPGVLEAMSPR